MRYISFRSFFFMILLPVSLLPVRSQGISHSSLLTPHSLLSKTDSGKISLNADLTGFFKNNEYFSPVAVGQTLPGTALNLALGYQVADKFKAGLGVYAVKYSGRNPLENLQPFVRLQYAITPRFSMVMGNLFGGVNHRLIEPLYQWERHFTDNPESGLQFVLHADRWFADVWIDWQHFIQRGDPAPESLAFGTSLARELTGRDSRFSLTVPLQLLIYHQGGQIDTSDEPMIVLGNMATGLCSRLNTNHKRIRSVGFDLFLAGYWDRYSNETLRPFDKGWGIYPVLNMDMTPFKLMAGYWYADKFYAFEGESLFGSFDPFRPQKQLPTRNLLTFKFIFDQQLLNDVSICAQLETYTDLDRGETDYSFGVHLRVKMKYLWNR